MMARATMAIAVFLLAATPLHAEVTGPLLPRKAIEIGFMLRDTDRVVEYEDSEARYTQRDLPVTVRYGLTSTATFSLELDGNPFNHQDDVGIYYTAGASIQALLWRHEEYVVTVGASYARTFAIDTKEPKTQYDAQFIDWTLLGQRSFDVRSQELTVWIGPRVSYMSTALEAPIEGEYYEAQNLFGGLVGVGILLIDHIVVQGQLAWIDEPEYRINLAYRF